MACKQHVHHTEQDSEAELQENIGDEFFGSIFKLVINVKNNVVKKIRR